jgi:hypothetical protein
MSRRSFVAASASLLLMRGGRPPVLRLALIPPSGAHPALESVRNGFSLGIDEARHTARLLGAEVEAVEPGGSGPPTAFLGGWDAGSARAGAALAAGVGALFLNVAAEEDALRGCDGALHVVPAKSMRPEGAVAWHPSLERFGAGQLNARFAARFQAGMDEAAWCAWAAVKLVAEAALRGREPTRLGSGLLSGARRFDGHKGVPLRFDPASGQLIQPLYVVRGQEVAEVEPLPVTGAVC